MLKDLILKNRTYRRFQQEHEITRTEIEELIDLARLSSSAGNLQQLKYIISNTTEKNKKIFANIRWAGYLKDWPGPVEGEKPSAYIVVLHDKSIGQNCFWDHGIAAQSILLGATEKGLGGCMFGSFDKVSLRAELKIDEKYEILMVIALGIPVEKVVLNEMDDSGNIKYWRDAEQVHHVPKRALKDMIID